MVLNYLMICISLMLPINCFAQINELLVQKVPLIDFTILSGRKINISYTFNPSNEILACELKSKGLSAIFWKYKNIEYAMSIPNGAYITFKGHQKPNGYFADPRGKVTIKNSRTNQNTLIVTCRYQKY